MFESSILWFKGLFPANDLLRMILSFNWINFSTQITFESHIASCLFLLNSYIHYLLLYLFFKYDTVNMLYVL